MHTLRDNSQFPRPLIKIEYNETEGISNFHEKYLGPSRLKGISDSKPLKQAIKKWKPEIPPRRLYMKFISKMSAFSKTTKARYFDNFHGI